MVEELVNKVLLLKQEVVGFITSFVKNIWALPSFKVYFIWERLALM